MSICQVDCEHDRARSIDWRTNSSTELCFVCVQVENMWSNSEFIEKYLRPMGSADRWDKFIYPAMKEAIVCSMLVAQDTIDTRKVSNDCQTLSIDSHRWSCSSRIHLNCSVLILCSAKISNLGSSKSIVVRQWLEAQPLQRTCATVFSKTRAKVHSCSTHEQLIWTVCMSLVMIDRKYNRTADTGRFELIHRGTSVPVPIYIGIDLRVEGKYKPNEE
jgi:hypothetical protein